MFCGLWALLSLHVNLHTCHCWHKRPFKWGSFSHHHPRAASLDGKFQNAQIANLQTCTWTFTLLFHYLNFISLWFNLRIVVMPYDDWRRVATDRKVVSHWEFSKRPPISEKLRTPTFKTKANFLKIVIDSSTSSLNFVEILDKYLIYVDTSWKGQSNGNFAWKVITQVRKGQNSYVPSFFMLTWRHFLNRQDWHWFRRVTSTTQLPFSLQT